MKDLVGESALLSLSPLLELGGITLVDGKPKPLPLIRVKQIQGVIKDATERFIILSPVQGLWGEDGSHPSGADQVVGSQVLLNTQTVSSIVIVGMA